MLFSITENNTKSHYSFVKRGHVKEQSSYCFSILEHKIYNGNLVSVGTAKF